MVSLRHVQQCIFFTQLSVHDRYICGRDRSKRNSLYTYVFFFQILDTTAGVYLGCFQEDESNRDLEHNAVDLLGSFLGMTAELCMRLCKKDG